MPKEGEICEGCGDVIRSEPPRGGAMLKGKDTSKPNPTCGNCMAPRGPSDRA